MRLTDRQTDGRTDSQRERQTDRQNVLFAGRVEAKKKRTFPRLRFIADRTATR